MRLEPTQNPSMQSDLPRDEDAQAGKIRKGCHHQPQEEENDFSNAEKGALPSQLHHGYQGGDDEQDKQSPPVPVKTDLLDLWDPDQDAREDPCPWCDYLVRWQLPAVVAFVVLLVVLSVVIGPLIDEELRDSSSDGTETSEMANDTVGGRMDSEIVNQTTSNTVVYSVP